MWKSLRRWWWLVFTSAVVSMTSSSLVLAKYGLISPDQIVVASWFDKPLSSVSKILGNGPAFDNATRSISPLRLSNEEFKEIMLSSFTASDLQSIFAELIPPSDPPSEIWQAGKGIAISGNFISNTGVLSLTASDGLFLQDGIIKNSDLGSSQSIFKTIKVNDSETLGADQNNDTLTFKAGNGINLSLNADEDVITIENTITSATLNGWNSLTNSVSLSTPTSDVVIGNGSTLGKVTILGDTDEKQLVIRGASNQSSSSLLQLQSNSGNALAWFSATGSLSLPSNGLQVGSNQLVVSNGKVGINTSNPTSTLEVNGDLRVSTNYGIKLKANTPTTGSISRLITLQATSQYDRPWISSLDSTGRHVAAFGIHGVNYTDGDTHNRWELKTAADPNGSQPGVMLTRYAIDYNRDLAHVLYSNIDTYGVHNNYGDRIQMVHNMTNSSRTASYNIGQWITELGTNDMTVMSLDAKTIDDTKDVTVRWLRETDTTGQRRFVIHKGDGTTTESFAVNAGTGTLRVYGDDETAFFGGGTNVRSFLNFQSNRAMVGYDGSYAVLQGGPSKGVKLNVGNSSYGQGTAVTIMPTGLVGIGTVTPTSLFSVGETSQFQVDSSGHIVAVGNITSSGALTFSAASSVQTSGDGDLTLGGGATGNVIVMPKATTGEVGIGTTDPLARFHVAFDGLSGKFGSGANSTGYIDFQSTRMMVGYDGSAAVIQGGNSKSIKFNVNNSSFGQGTAVTIDSTGKMGIGIAPTLGPLHMASGAYVTAGGDWTNASDRNLKTNFIDLDNDLILDKIAALPLVEWSFKTEVDQNVRHFGPMAQDFYTIFGLGNNNTSISTIDPSGIALAGVQGLYLKMNLLTADVAALEQAAAVEPESQAVVFPDETDNFAVKQTLQSLGKFLAVGQAQFEQLVTFSKEVVFAGVARFRRAPEFSTETAGLAIIQPAAQEVVVTFDRPYSVAPIVNVSQMLTSEDSIDAVFSSGQRFVITDVTPNSFRIVLNGPATQRTRFSWIALQVDTPNTSVGDTPVIVPAAIQSDSPDPVIILNNSPTPSPIIQPEPTSIVLAQESVATSEASIETPVATDSASL